MGDLLSDQTLTEVLAYVSSKGVYFGGIGAFLFYLVQVFLMWNRRQAQTAFQQVANIAILGGAATSAGFAFNTFTSDYAPRPVGQKAAVAIIEEYNACALRVLAMKPEALAFAESNGTPAKLQCLAYAYQSNMPQSVPELTSKRLVQDLELGFGLIKPDVEKGKQAFPKDVTPIADVLYQYFGLHADRFLGTGFSMPGVVIDDSNVDYGDATLREYLVPNVCGEAKAPEVCPAREPSTWAWTLPIQTLIDNKLSLRDVLLAKDPNMGRERFANWRDNIKSNKTDGVIVRFQKFAEEYYNGLVGRKEARYVFFSDIQGTIDLPLREAFRRSGQTDFEKDAANPSKRVFIWVQVPAGGHYNRQATWHSVFELLKSISVDKAFHKPHPKSNGPAALTSS